MPKFFQDTVAKKIQSALKRKLVGKTVKEVRLLDGKYTSPYIEVFFSAKKSVVFQYNDTIRVFLFGESTKNVLANPEFLKKLKKRYKSLMRKPSKKKGKHVVKKRRRKSKSK